MAKTQLADIIVPAQFAGYVLQRTAEKSDLFQSGIVVRTPDYDERAAHGGTQVNMPHWNDLTGNRQPLSDSAPLVPAKLVADQDIARIHNDGNAWSWNHLATVVAGDDPALALANFLADYWNRQNQYMLISSLKGVFAAASMAGNLLAIHSESCSRANCCHSAQRRNVRGCNAKAWRPWRPAGCRGDALGGRSRASQARPD